MPNFAQVITTDKAKLKDWHNYFANKNADLETQFTELLFGTRAKLGGGYVKVGYEKLREFYNGEQWQSVPEGGQRMVVYNQCRNVVNNYTAFMTNEFIDIDVPASDITDKIEVARAEAKEKILIDVLNDNNFKTKYESAVQNGSLLGDSIMLGPFYDEENDRIIVKNVKKPENVRIIWKDDEFTEMFGYIHTYYVSEEEAYTMFPEAKEKGITFNTVDISVLKNPGGSSSKTGRTGPSSVAQGRFMVELADCWTEDSHVTMVGTKDLVNEINKYGFVPAIHILNIPHPTDPFGTSDIEDMIDPQVEYNERNADMSEIISETAFPWIFGKNLDPTEVSAGRLNLIDIGDEADIIPDPRRAQTANLENEINRRLSSIFNLSGLNENIFGGQGVKSVTGRALAVLMQTINNRVKGRQTRWTLALQTLFANIFKIAESENKEAKEIVNGEYKTDIFFPGTLLRNIVDEINKFNAKLQSQETTMKNLGVPSPSDEKKLMKEELQDQIMTVEISKNPQLQLQLHKMLTSGIADKIAGNKPQLSEEDNIDAQPDANGGAGNQSATSPEGAIAQNAQRGGGNVNLEAEA